MFKFKLGQLVYYINLNKLHSAKIIARKYVDKIETDFDVFNNDKPCKLYATIHGTFYEENLFSSKEELAKNLIGEQ